MSGAHSFFSPSKGAMWMNCPGSLAMPENQQQGESTSFADDGTASHTLAGWALLNNKDCKDFPDENILVNGVAYPVDDERIERIQGYVDDVRREALGGLLFTEYRVDLSKWLGMAPCWTCKGSGGVRGPSDALNCPACNGSGEEPQGGTSDTIVVQPRKKWLLVADLKDGSGEKVYAKTYNDDGTWKINEQLGLYGGGVLNDIMMLGYDIERVTLRIYQEKLGHRDEVEVTVEELLEFMDRAEVAAEKSGEAMVFPVDKLDAEGLLVPGEKTCRWCAAKARCPAYKRVVEEETRMNFDDESEPVVPESTEHLSRAYKKVAMVEAWVKAVKSGVWNGVAAGKEIIGPDGQPLKFVQGPQGNRKWEDELAAEAALTGQLADKAYQPSKLITAPAAAKLLDKKATKQIWKDVFEPLIHRPKGGPVLALGSDKRPVFGGTTAESSEFDEEIGVSE